MFLDKNIIPNDDVLKLIIPNQFNLWQELKFFTLSLYPNGVAEWNYSGKINGWHFRIKDKKRTIIYFLPRDSFFKVAFVFGEKAFDFIQHSNVNSEIINELSLAKKYAEGRGIRIDVVDNLKINDIKELIKIKLKF